MCCICGIQLPDATERLSHAMSHNITLKEALRFSVITNDPADCNIMTADTVCPACTVYLTNFDILSKAEIEGEDNTYLLRCRECGEILFVDCIAGLGIFNLSWVQGGWLEVDRRINKRITCEDCQHFKRDLITKENICFAHDSEITIADSAVNIAQGCELFAEFKRNRK